MPSDLSASNGALDDETLKALSAAMSHQLRARLIHVLAIEPGSGAEELSGWLEVPLPTLRRHLRALGDAGVIEVQSSEERRGARKLYFVNRRIPIIDTEADARLSDRQRRLGALGTLRCVFEESRAAVSAPVFGERHDYMTSSVPGKVDERGWTELSELVHESMDRAMRIVEESGERLVDGEGEDAAIPVTSAFLLLEMPARTRRDQ